MYSYTVTCTFSESILPSLPCVSAGRWERKGVLEGGGRGVCECVCVVMGGGSSYDCSVVESHRPL